MTQFDNSNRASLWHGDKSKNANAPDLKGTVNINGQDYNISLWTNQKASGPKSPAYTGSVELKQAAPNNAYAGGQGHAQQAPSPQQGGVPPHPNQYNTGGNQGNW